MISFNMIDWKNQVSLKHLFSCSILPVIIGMPTPLADIVLSLFFPNLPYQSVPSFKAWKGADRECLTYKQNRCLASVVFLTRQNNR